MIAECHYPGFLIQTGLVYLNNPITLSYDSSW